MGDFTLRLQITDGALTVGIGPHPAPDLVVERQNDQGIHALMTGATTPGQALADGSVRVEGDPALLHRFVEAFRF
ncbi:SCP2 sterol-binding domain-containing protein [Microbispora sp. CA-102843]|uniref:SCP2 sterol-binding domain-containing protein n=1 Tax=Microbispora sp. CA-102843 TaxID=3239952 RepID=UPI003D8C4C59